MVPNENLALKGRGSQIEINQLVRRLLICGKAMMMSKCLHSDNPAIKIITFIQNEHNVHIGRTLMSILNKFFATKEREKVITYLLNNPSKPHRVRDVAKKLSISLGGISGFFAILRKNKILKRSGNEFRIDTTNPLAKATKMMINIMGLDIGPLKRIPGLEGVGVYGSCANGTDNEDSDIDLWAKVNKSVDLDVVAAVSRQLKEKMKRDVQLLILDPEKLAQLKEEDPIFFYSLIYGSVVLYGKSPKLGTGSRAMVS